MLTGYVLVKHPRVRVAASMQTVLWTVLPTLAISCIVVTGYWNRSIDNQPTLIGSSAYVAFRGTVWSLALAWIIFALCTGRAQFLNHVLSWSGFVPLSRLSFGIFLTHMLILNYRYFSIKQTQTWNDFDFVSCLIVFCVAQYLTFFCHIGL